MQEQLMKITIEGVFKYFSMLVHRILFQEGDRLPIALHMQDDQQVIQAVTQWTSMITRNSNEFKFSDFIDCFIHSIAQILSSHTEPRISPEIKRMLHLSDQAKTGDWYLYQNYTKIRVYGYELAPYKLPKYVPMRIFSLEYIRQIINMDELHFISGKRKS